jgi:pimeloyl-ACP methyl ester carboxylesterase
MAAQHATVAQWVWMQLVAFKAVLQVMALTIPAILLPGCLGKRLADEQRLRHGLILVLPGIEGESYINHSIARGFQDAGIPDAIEIFDWTRGRLFLFDNLMNYPRNLEQADRLAERIRQYQREYPDRPVHLVAHSGGGGLAVLAMERLDPNRPIAAAILMAPALSPAYNLAPALRRTTYGVYNLYSPYDNFYLAAGTTAFGTIDRKRTLAAGRVGFKMPEGLPAADADVYRTLLHQEVWRYEMLADGHAGGHLGWSDRRFVKTWVSRIILNHRLGKITRF